MTWHLNRIICRFVFGLLYVEERYEHPATFSAYAMIALCCRIDLSRKRKDIQKEVIEQVVGKTVLTRYNNKTYRIDDVLFDENPLSTFTNSAGVEQSYMDYYK